ncbi:MAG: hypothetical protein HOQ07_14810 [Sinomonas sp.]|nr:hypothetical protein [Sinomonas sp.]
MKSKTAAWAAGGTTEGPHRRKNGAARQEMVQALLVAAIILGVVVTIFAPQLQAFAVDLFHATSR